VASHKRKVVSV